MADVESLTSSVVREYLSRKGLKDTLATLDKEMPRTDSCINNRAQLAKELHINGLMKKNKESHENFRTMLEVIVQFMVAKSWAKQVSQSSTGKGQKGLEQSTKVISPRKEENDFENLDFYSKETEKNFQKKYQLPENSPKNFIKEKEYKMEDRSTSRRKNLSTSSEEALNTVLSFPASIGQTIAKKTENLSNNQRKVNIDKTFDVINAEKSPSFGRTGNEVMEDSSSMTYNDDLASIKDLKRKENSQKNIDNSKSDYAFNNTQQSPGDSSLKKSGSNLKTKSSRRHIGNISGAIHSTGLNNPRKNARTHYCKDILTEDFDRQYETNMNSRNVFASRSGKIDHFLSDNVQIDPAKKANENDMTGWTRRNIQNKESKKSNLEPQTCLTSKKNESHDELLFEDVDDNLDKELDNLDLYISQKPAFSSTQSQPITLKIAKELKSVIFGSSMGVFNKEWRNQGFSFSEIDHLKYGIVQHKGGPCGLLASVQAIVLKHLLFGGHSAHNVAKQPLRFSSKETNDALCSALTEILWRAGSYEQAVVTLRSDQDQFVSSPAYKPDQFTEKLMLHEFYDHSELGSFVKENITQFSSDLGGGSILLLYSVILSRTIKTIREDMDDPKGTLMGAHGYCTQDMVNLLLTGKAVSNTFDDVIELDAGGETKNVLKGIDEQSDIGLLSLFEYYKSCLVGSNFKNPRYPIWVVCSESHFSVLFSLKRSLMNERRPQKRFDLYYYDGLARQEEEIRLTVDTTSGRGDGMILEDLTPPLELCIRTKWNNAEVNWNGSEPLL